MEKIYLALGDSMSIDEYTGVKGGGAASQFYKFLGEGWTFLDLTVDGCSIPNVPVSATGDVITLTVGGNDALQHFPEPTQEDVNEIVADHLGLVKKVRRKNPDSLFIIGNVYAPAFPLDQRLADLLESLNNGIASNIRQVNGHLADIYTTFKGHESEFLCQQIEPTLKGAAAIAELFKDVCWRTGDC